MNARRLDRIGCHSQLLDWGLAATRAGMVLISATLALTTRTDSSSGGRGSARPGIICHPIGHVENEWKEPAPPEQIRATESRVVIDHEYAQGLDGIELCEYLTIIFHFDRAEGYTLLQHPRGDVDRPLRGVFSICSPYRPNHLGVSFPRLLRREGNTLHVTGLDALDGTPVLDVKPFAAPDDERPKEK